MAEGDGFTRSIPGALTEAQVVQRLALSFFVLYGVAFALGATRRVSSLPFTAAGGVTLLGLWTWRAMVARMSGANFAVLWPFLGAPVLVVGTLAVLGGEMLVRRRRATHLG